MAAKKFERDELRALWRIAKAEEPLLSRDLFAQRINSSLRALERALSGMGPQDRDDVAKFIAGKIDECAVAMGCLPHEVVWHMFKTWANVGYGGDNSVGLQPHHITLAGGFNRIRDTYFLKKPTSQVVSQQRIADASAYNRRLGATFAREQFTRESIEEFSSRVFKGRVDAPKSVPKLKEQKRVVTAVWSDLHFGADIQAGETGLLDYGTVEEARSFAKVVAECADYKSQYRDTTTLRILSLGDVIEGKLHDREDGAAQAEQFCRAVHLKSQGVAYLAQAYSQVEVWCVSGNHDRDKARHYGRATSHKADSWGTAIAYATMQACSNLTNVKWHIPQTSYLISEVLGSKTFATHGDGTLSPGNPGKTVNTSALENQINRFNADMRQHARDLGHDFDDFSVAVCGHVHVPMATHLPNGVVMVTNGGLPPVNGFGINGMGRFSAARGQYLWESVEGYAFGDSRLIRVDARTHQDASLDAIIKPWGGLP